MVTRSKLASPGPLTEHLPPMISRLARSSAGRSPHLLSVGFVACVARCWFWCWHSCRSCSSSCSSFCCRLGGVCPLGLPLNGSRNDPEECNWWTFQSFCFRLRFVGFPSFWTLLWLHSLLILLSWFLLPFLFQRLKNHLKRHHIQPVEVYSNIRVSALLWGLEELSPATFGFPRKLF